MATSPSSSVQQARKDIADRLREIQKDAGLSNRALARLAGWHESRVYRLLIGRTPPTDQDIRQWCQICGVPEEIPNLIAASRTAESAYIEWRRVQRSMKQMQSLTERLHEDNDLYRFYSSNVIPWPLQTPGYMRGLMLRFTEFHQAEMPDIEEGVKARIARRRYLKNPSRRCAILIEETILRNWVFDKDVIREQLEYLLVGMRQANVSLGVLPMHKPRKQKPAETFHLYGENAVSIETISAILTITQPREVGLYVRCFTDLAEDAVYGREARSMIKAAIDELG